MARKPYKYKKSMCKSLIKYMSQGNSYMTWGPSQEKTISVSTMYEWEGIHDEWKEAKETGYAMGLKFFEALIVGVAIGKVPEWLKKLGSSKIDLTAVIFVLKTRFHKEYGEISKVDHTSKGEAINVHFVGTGDNNES